MKQVIKTNMTNLDLLKLESKAAEAKINEIKKRLAQENDSNTTEVPVVVQSN